MNFDNIDFNELTATAFNGYVSCRKVTARLVELGYDFTVADIDKIMEILSDLGYRDSDEYAPG